MLLYGDISLLPADLQPYTELVEVPFPSKRELMRLLETMCGENGHEPLSGDDMQELVSDLAGLGLYDARRLVFRLFNARTERGVRLIDDPPRRRRTVMDMKKQSLLRHGGLLTLCKPKKGALAGMNAYTRWVNDNKSGMLAPEDCLLERGTPPLNGVLLCGVPGCGKSEAAKILYYQWDEQLPLLLLSVDQLMGGYVGDSERNMRLALSQAEAMAPCILWIEELDKGLQRRLQRQRQRHLQADVRPAAGVDAGQGARLLHIRHRERHQPPPAGVLPQLPLRRALCRVHAHIRRVPGPVPGANAPR